MSFGAVTFSQDSFSGAGGTSINVAISGVSSSVSLGNVSVVGNAVTLVSGTNATRIVGVIGSLSVVGTAVVALGSTSGTTSVGSATVTSTTFATTSGVVATTELGTVGFSTTGSVTPLSVEATTSIGSATVSTTAIVSVSSVQATTAVNTFASVVGTASVTPASVVGSLIVNAPTVIGTANISISGSGVQANSALGTVSVIASAFVEPDSVVLTGSIGNLSLVGTANVSIAANTASNETRALGIATAPTVIGTASVDVTGDGFVATVQFGGASAVVSADANVTLAENVQESNYDTAIYDSNFFSSSGLVVVSNVGTLSIVGTATFTLASVQGTITLNAPTVIGNAIVEPTGFQVNGSVGTLSFVGNANVSLTSTSATATLGTVSVIGNAVIEIASVVLSSFFSTNYIYTAVSAEDYNKDRTVYVDFKDNFINNVVVIEEEDRTIYIPEKQHNVRSKTLLAA
tara:strand:- start:3206 stop:4588 length:1383 start_codon:yes stop_codon:yes gene_type:complete